ncbi:hypothetical protein RCH07_003009 [Arthrobacter sp. CG_A4]|nr:hypothetical protein [Arthrobacter sp. CG_A4]
MVPDGVQFRETLPGDRLDEDVDDPAAGQADGVGIVVADPVAHQDRCAFRFDPGGQLEHGALNAAAGNRTDGFALRGDNHGCPGEPRGGHERAHNGGQAGGAALLPARHYCREHITHWRP